MKKREFIEGYRKTTWVVHGPAHSVKWDYSHHVVPPMTSSTTYRLESVARGARGFAELARAPHDSGEPPIYVYDRLGEPTRGMLEGELAQLEGGEACLTFSSGMAAISAAMGFLLKVGDEIVAHDLVYGCTHSLFTSWHPRQGVAVKRADFRDMKAVARAITPRTRLLYFESPVNPTLELIDMAALRKVRDEANKGRKPEARIMSIIDNTFASPFCQRPLEHGVDIVVHSLTKNIGGFGTEIGGAVILKRDLYPHLYLYRKDFGGVLSSKSAWAILVYGVPTIPLRVKRQQYSATRVAKFLEAHPCVEQVVYPGLQSFPQRELAERQLRDFDGDFAPGSMIYFRVRADMVDPVEFVDDLAVRAYSVTLAVSLGHVKTLIEVPSGMTHSAYGCGGAMRAVDGIRLSIGLESPVDIIKDLDASLRRVARKALSTR